jgi:enoyl-CoA hydratase/carnithine racemase
MSHVVTQTQDRVLTIRLNRPEKKNALTQAMYAAMAGALRAAQADSAVRAVLLTGAQDCFCAGNDVMDFLNAPIAGTENPVGQFMQALSAIEKPVLAAVSGSAVGIGVTMLLHCDLVYAGEQTRFHMPFVSLGICPEFASTYILPRLMGHVRAFELLFTGPFDAAKAREYGLINSIAPNADVESVARKQALAIAKLPPKASRVTKSLLKRWRADVVQQAIPLEAEHFTPMLREPEAIEALTAFAQKRQPDFARFA